MTIFKAACVQLNSGNDMTANLRAAGEHVRAAAGEGAQLVMLPEYAALLDGSGRVMRENSYPEEQHPALSAFRALAQETRVWLLVGSITVKTQTLMANRSYLLSPDGAVAAVTLDYVLDRLVICGSVNSVVDQLLAFREITGDFGTLLYAGHDWADPRLARRSMELMAEQVMPAVNAAIGCASRAA